MLMTAYCMNRMTVENGTLLRDIQMKWKITYVSFHTFSFLFTPTVPYSRFS